MLRNESNTSECGPGLQTQSASAVGGTKQWQFVDEKLRGLAQQYLALDAQLAGWLREAERVQVWRHFGCATMLEYLERVFGYSPRQGRERLLVARRLAALPELEAALNNGELPYTAVRELSRVATPTTESAWVQEAHGKCLREIEDMVSQREPGDFPEDPPRPDLAPTRVVFEGVMPETYAFFRQVWKLLESEHGSALSDEQLLSAMLTAAVAPPDDEARKGRAKFQIAITTCEWCKRSMQHGGGRRFAIDTRTRQRAECDAQFIGSLEADAPERATRDVTERTKRFIKHRDGYRCRAPGCRSARFLEVHHIVHREDGGTNDPSNLILMCDAHHKEHHDGLITISGTAPHDVIFNRGSAWLGSGRRLPVDGDPVHPRIEDLGEDGADAMNVGAMTHVGHELPPMTHVGRDTAAPMTSECTGEQAPQQRSKFEQVRARVADASARRRKERDAH